MVKKGFHPFKKTILCVCLAASAYGANFYVASDGDDNRSGTSPQQAWKSLAKANAMDFAPGDSLLLEGGMVITGKLTLTQEHADTAQRPVVISTYGMGHATIQAGSGSAVEVKNAGGVHVKNLILKGRNRRTNEGAGVLFVNELPGAVK